MADSDFRTFTVPATYKDAILEFTDRSALEYAQALLKIWTQQVLRIASKYDGEDFYLDGVSCEFTPRPYMDVLHGADSYECRNEEQYRQLAKKFTSVPPSLKLYVVIIARPMFVIHNDSAYHLDRDRSSLHFAQLQEFYPPPPTPVPPPENENIKELYRRLVKSFHPDLHPEQQRYTGYTGYMQLINGAFSNQDLRTLQKFDKAHPTQFEFPAIDVSNHTTATYQTVKLGNGLILRKYETRNLVKPTRIVCEEMSALFCAGGGQERREI